MAIEINGSMTGSELKTQLEKIATKGELCSNLTTSFKDVSNPICTLNDMSGAIVQFWVSLLVQSLYCWENNLASIGGYDVPLGFSTTNRILDVFKSCSYKVGEILFAFAKAIGNNFDVFPLDNLKKYETWEEILASKEAVDDICSFYPIFSMIDYMHGDALASAAKSFGSKVYYIKNGYFWNGGNIENGYNSGQSCVCGVFTPFAVDDIYNNSPAWNDVKIISPSNCIYDDGGVLICSNTTEDRYGDVVAFSGFSCFRKKTGHSSKNYWHHTNIISTVMDSIQAKSTMTIHAEISILNSYFDSGTLFSVARNVDDLGYKRQSESPKFDFFLSDGKVYYYDITSTMTYAVNYEIVGSAVKMSYKYPKGIHLFRFRRPVRNLYFTVE